MHWSRPMKLGVWAAGIWLVVFLLVLAQHRFEVSEIVVPEAPPSPATAARIAAEASVVVLVLAACVGFPAVLLRADRRWPEWRWPRRLRKWLPLLLVLLWPIGLLVGFFWLYFLPTIIANRKEHPHRGAIFIVNLFLGLTVLGWVIPLAWAMSEPDAREAAPEPAGAFCPRCGAASREGSLFCARCGERLEPAAG